MIYLLGISASISFNV